VFIASTPEGNDCPLVASTGGNGRILSENLIQGNLAENALKCAGIRYPSDMSRVTRLGEFSILGRIFDFWANFRFLGEFSIFGQFF
jgi:hypothetical protein